MLKLSEILVSKPHQSTKSNCGVHAARNTKPGSRGQQEAASFTLVPGMATLLIIFSVCLAIKGKGEALLGLRADGARGGRRPALCVPTSGTQRPLLKAPRQLSQLPYARSQSTEKKGDQTYCHIAFSSLHIKQASLAYLYWCLGQKILCCQKLPRVLWAALGTISILYHSRPLLTKMSLTVPSQAVTSYMYQCPLWLGQSLLGLETNAETQVECLLSVTVLLIQ